MILQDIDAVAYRLAEHLPALEAYVRSGGGLIMVGGPASFAGGHYARTPLERALPVGDRRCLRAVRRGRVRPRLHGLGSRGSGYSAAALRLLGDELPKMPGANIFGKKREGALALWEHPGRAGKEGRMPVLVLGDYVDGRTIALGVDGTHLLAFSGLRRADGGARFRRALGRPAGLADA